MKLTKLIVIATLFLSIGLAGCATNRVKTPKIQKPFGYTEIETYEEKIQRIYDKYFEIVWGRVVDENDVAVTGAIVSVILDGKWHEERSVLDKYTADEGRAGRFFVRVPKNRRVFIGAYTYALALNKNLLLPEITNGVGQFVNIGENYLNIDEIKLVIKRKGSITITGKVYKPSDYVSTGDFNSEVRVCLTEMPNFIVKSTHTDNNGNFVIDNLQPGDYCIRSFDGRYTAEILNIKLNPGPNHLDLYLKEEKK